MNIATQQSKMCAALAGWLLCLLVAAPAQSASPAATVVIAKGTVTATGNTGQRALARRAEVFATDLVRTADASRTQLRFVDEALLTLDAGSELAIDTYRYRAGDSGNAVHLRLLRGSLRTVTGLIGEQNRAAWKLETPVSSIGIRGTSARVGHFPESAATASQTDLFDLPGLRRRFAAQIGGEPFSLVIVDQGRMSVENRYGSVEIGPGGNNGALIVRGRAPMAFRTAGTGADPVDDHGILVPGPSNDAPVGEAGRPRDGDSGLLQRITP